MALSRAGYSQLETRAERGEITVKKLGEAAQALFVDAELAATARAVSGADRLRE
jgi:hypothetical protein